MKTVGIRALKQNASAVVAEAAAGLLRRGSGSIGDLPPPLEIDGPSLSETLEEMRSDERF